MDAFDALPLACIVNEKYFCVHGGISDKVRTVILYKTIYSSIKYKKFKEASKYP